MRSNIFRKKVDLCVLYNLLDQICLKTDKFYCINETAFRKMIFLNLHVPFLEYLLPFYWENKKHYVLRDLTFQGFITIIKQIAAQSQIVIQNEIRRSDGDCLYEYHLYHT